jgi:hypothetical protein
MPTLVGINGFGRIGRIVSLILSSSEQANSASQVFRNAYVLPRPPLDMLNTL